MKGGDKVLFSPWNHKPPILVTIIKEDRFGHDGTLGFYWVDCNTWDGPRLVHRSRLEVVDNTEMNDILF